MKPKYYNGDKLLSRHYMVNVVCGSRFGGKSTWAQRYVIKRAIRDHNNQFAVIIRYDSDKTEMCPTYFDNTMMMWYPDFELKYKKGQYWMKNNKNGETWLAGYVFALSKATKMKSSSYPLINTMIYEEFINLEGKYIKNATNPDLEAELLISLIQTVFRGNGKQFRDDGRILCVSNAYGLNNPLFRYFGVIDKIIENPFKQFYEIREKRDKDGNIEKPAILIERVDNDIDDGFGSSNSGSKWTDFRNELKIVKKPTVKKIYVQLSFDNKKFVNISKYNESLLATLTDKKDDKMYAFSCSDVRKSGIFNIDVLKKEAAYKTIMDVFNKNTMYYDGLETYIELYNILSF